MKVGGSQKTKKKNGVRLDVEDTIHKIFIQKKKRYKP